jgi:hypothetical protein
MNFRRLSIIGLVAGLLAGANPLPAQAHHSFPATYLVDQMITIQGTVTQFLYRNPHSFVHVVAADPKSGAVVEWAIEWGGSDSLAGITHTTLRPGDKVVVVGNPARDTDSHRMRMRAIERPSDGWKWSGTFG